MSGPLARAWDIGGGVEGRPARTTASDGGMKVSIGRHVDEGQADLAFRAESDLLHALHDKGGP